MRITTSRGAVSTQFKQLHDKLVEQVGLTDGEEGRWVWIWKHREGTVPRTWRLSEKKDPKFYVAAGVKEGYADVVLELSNGKVKSETYLPRGKFPLEIFTFFERRVNGSSSWKGSVIEIWQPQHQQHPGLAEYAVVGAIEDSNGLIFLLSDGKNPIGSPLWHAYRLQNNVAIPMLFMFDKDAQKAFWGCLDGSDFTLKGRDFRRVPEIEWEEQLSGKRFSWALSSEMDIPSIPDKPRKFKLGETLAPIEKKSVQAKVIA